MHSAMYSSIWWWRSPLEEGIFNCFWSNIEPKFSSPPCSNPPFSLYLPSLPSVRCGYAIKFAMNKMNLDVHSTKNLLLLQTTKQLLLLWSMQTIIVFVYAVLFSIHRLRVCLPGEADSLHIIFFDDGGQVQVPSFPASATQYRRLSWRRR